MMEVKNKRSRKIRTRVILIVIVVVLAAAAVTGYSIYHYAMNKLNQFDIVTLKGDMDIDPQVNRDLKQYRNILLLGIDTRAGESDEHCRSDASLVVSINKETNKVRLISVVRDSFLSIEENGQVRLDKLTHAHAYAGPRNTIRAVNRNLDLNIREYVRVNWQTVADTVDALGGITVTIKKYEIHEINKYIKDTNKSLKGNKTPIRKAGKQKLNGIQAVTYCRIRHVGNGDVERAQRMRIVLKQCYQKIKQMKLTQLSALADKVFPEIRTNISSKEMGKLLLHFMDYNITKSQGWPYTWDGATIDGVSYDVPITLRSNVIKLHEEAFHQKNYKPTRRVTAISEQVAERSGYYDMKDAVVNEDTD